MLFTITFDRTSPNTPKISPFATLLVQAYYIVGQIATSGISLRLHLGKYYAWVTFFGRELRETHTSDILCISLWARKGRNNHHVVWVVNWPIDFFSLVHHSKFGYNYHATVLWSAKSELMKMYNWPRGKWSHHLFQLLVCLDCLFIPRLELFSDSVHVTDYICIGESLRHTLNIILLISTCHSKSRSTAQTHLKWSGSGHEEGFA